MGVLGALCHHRLPLVWLVEVEDVEQLVPAVKVVLLVPVQVVLLVLVLEWV